MARPKTTDTVVKFRATFDQLAMLKVRASKKDMTVAEMLRADIDCMKID